MLGFFLKSSAMLLAWTGLLMVFTSAGGSMLMLGELLIAVCAVTYLLAHAPRAIARLAGAGTRESRHQSDLAT